MKDLAISCMVWAPVFLYFIIKIPKWRKKRAKAKFKTGQSLANGKGYRHGLSQSDTTDSTVDFSERLAYNAGWHRGRRERDEIE